MSLPKPLPDLTFFIDRSLGRKKVPAILRVAGLRLNTLAEVYGTPEDEQVKDPAWLARAGAEGWPVLMKDSGISKDPFEKHTVTQHGVRCFCIGNGKLSAQEMAGWILSALGEIALACNEPGGFIYTINRNGLVAVTTP